MQFSRYADRELGSRKTSSYGASTLQILEYHIIWLSKARKRWVQGIFEGLIYVLLTIRGEYTLPFPPVSPENPRTTLIGIMEELL